MLYVQHAKHSNKTVSYDFIIGTVLTILGDSSGSTSSSKTSELKGVIRKMYAENTDNIDEILTIKVPHQVSIGIILLYIVIALLYSNILAYLLFNLQVLMQFVARSQLDIANLLHGDSIRYEKQNKSLQSIAYLHKVTNTREIVPLKFQSCCTICYCKC